jgi:excisionase family DNA binding protein
MREHTSSGEQEENDRLLTVSEAAALLGISPLSLYHFISQRRVPVIRISSRCVRFSRLQLLEWIGSLTHPPEQIP